MRRRLRRLLGGRVRPCRNCREADCRCLPLDNWLDELRYGDGVVRPVVRVGRHVVERVRQTQVRIPAWQPAGESYSSI